LQQRLEFGLLLVWQLETVGPEDLDAVVVVRVVGGRDDDAGVATHARGQIGDAGCRKGTGVENEAAHGVDPGSQSRLEHVARAARVFADEDLGLVAFTRKVKRDRFAQPRSHFDGHGVLVGQASNSVGSEKCAHSKSFAFL